MKDTYFIFVLFVYFVATLFVAHWMPLRGMGMLFTSVSKFIYSCPFRSGNHTY
jgi:hypothetical protein